MFEAIRTSTKQAALAHTSPTTSRIMRLAVVSLAATFSGCAYTGSFRDYVDNGFKVGPEYRKPAAPVADAWIDQYDTQVRSELPNYADWWASFNDPILDSLMEETYQQNLSLRSAGLRVLQARYARAIAVGGLFPQQQQANGSFTQTNVSKNITNSPPDRFFGTGSVGFSAAWEVDFWGKFRRNIESADASLDATVEDYDAVLVSLLGETASAYINLRTAQQRLQYARGNVAIQEQSLNYAQTRFQAGAVTELDVTQAENILASTQQAIPLYETQVRNANNNLCVLLGIPTRDLSHELGLGPIPTPPSEVVVGVPANLLRRRPDVRAAERQVAAQSAVIGVATADLLPHFSILGSIALNADDFSDLFKSTSTTGAISPGFNWNILNYGRLVNNVNLQDAVFQQLAVDYQQTVLQANAEVETAINSFLKSQLRVQYLNRAVHASQQSVDLAVAQYRSGAIDFNRVFNLQTALVQDQDTLAVVQGDIALSLISTYTALGGGWEIRRGIRRGAMISATAPPQIPNPSFNKDSNPDLNTAPDSDDGGAENNDPATVILAPPVDPSSTPTPIESGADRLDERMLPPVPTDDQ